MKNIVSTVAVFILITAFNSASGQSITLDHGFRIFDRINSGNPRPILTENLPALDTSQPTAFVNIFESGTDTRISVGAEDSLSPFVSAKSTGYGEFIRPFSPAIGAGRGFEFGSTVEIRVSDYITTSANGFSRGTISGVYGKGSNEIPFRISGTSLEISGHGRNDPAGTIFTLPVASLFAEIKVTPVDVNSSAANLRLAYGGSLEDIDADGFAAIQQIQNQSIPLTGTLITEPGTNFDKEPSAKYIFDDFDGLIDLSSYEDGELFTLEYFWNVAVEFQSDGAFARAAFFDPLDPSDGPFIDLSGHTPVFVPIPAAFWLFGTAILGLVGWNKRKEAIN